MFHFVLAVILFADGKYVQGGDKVTSKVSPKHVDIGETATVTCHFPYDISQMTTVWVIVEHHPDNEPVGEKVDLAECTKRNTSELKCIVLERGYVIENDVKTSLELRITNILARQAGFYRCLLVPPEGEILKSKKRRLSLLGGDKVTCKASPKQVKIGETATVTCQFPYDVSQMTTAWIVVDHFPVEPERREVYLVDCTKFNSQELECNVLKEGYVIEGKVTTSLKLRIANISAQHSGHYRCQMVPPEGKRPKAKQCRLVVFNVIPVPTTTERTIETSAGVESNGNGSDMDKETNSAMTSDVRDWLPVTAVIVVLLATAAVIVIVLRNRRLQKGSGDEAGEMKDRGVYRNAASTVSKRHNNYYEDYIALLVSTKTSFQSLLDCVWFGQHGHETVFCTCKGTMCGQMDEAAALVFFAAWFAFTFVNSIPLFIKSERVRHFNYDLDTLMKKAIDPYY